VCAGSDTAHLALLGYDPYKYYTGRGPLEAAGVGLRLREGDVAFRCNFATVEERSGELIVRDRRAGRIKEGTAELARALDGVKLVDGRVSALFRESVAHRAALVLRGEGLSGWVNDVDPHAEDELLHHCKPTVDAGHSEYDAARRTAQAVNEFVALSHRVLEEQELNEERRGAGQLPANCILPRGGGLVPHIPAFPERHNVRAAAMVEVGLLNGLLGSYLGLELLECPGATGGMDTDIEAMAASLDAAWERYDFLFCNVKAPDLAGHDDNPGEKVRACELVDQLLGLLRKRWEGQTIVAVTADHSTPCECMDHSGDPVPLLIHGPGVRPDCGESFDEFACPAGSLGRLRGADLIPVLFNLANRYVKFGA